MSREGRPAKHRGRRILIVVLVALAVVAGVAVASNVASAGTR